MNVEQVVDKIIAEANEKAQQIKAENNDAIFAYQQQTDEMVAKYQEQSNELATKASKEERLRILATARMNSRSEILAKKQAILTELQSKVEAKMAEISQDEFCKLYSGLIEKNATKGDEVILAGTDESFVDAGFIDQINEKNGKKLSLSNEKAQFARGVSIASGSVSINLAFETLIDVAKVALEREITSRLFAE